MVGPSAGNRDGATMDYELPPTMMEGGVGAGTSVLLAGPPGSGKRELLWETLTTGRKGGSVLVTMADPVDDRGFAFERVGPDEPEVHAVDATGEIDVDAVDGLSEPYQRVEVVDGPEDFTGIGMSLASRLEELTPPNPHRRVGVDGVAPLLDAVDWESVYKFLRRMADRAEAADWLFVATLDTEAVDEVDYNLVEQAFDRVLETRPADDG
jgi:KaiC/GvpD/RAD55 family RecA-like ATPase